MLDIKRLGHVVALADECHFARAAERVHLSQPAFSRSIQAIEAELGLRLFDRAAGQVRPTPAGTFLIERARRLLSDARALQREATLYRDGALGDTAFGAGPFPATTLLPRVVAALRQQHPGVGLRLELGNWELLLQRLLAEDIEFFIADRRDLPADPQIRITPLGRQPVHLYVRSGHPLAGRTCRFSEVWRHGIGATRMPSAVKALIGRLLTLPTGQAPVLAVECDDMHLLRRLALDSDTVIASSDTTLREELAATTLVRLEVSDLPDIYADMGLVELANRTPSPMAHRAMEGVRAAVHQPV